jgi:hypothetical protein
MTGHALDLVLVERLPVRNWEDSMEPHMRQAIVNQIGAGRAL